MLKTARVWWVLFLPGVACTQDLSGPGAAVHVAVSVAGLTDSAAVGSLDPVSGQLRVAASDGGQHAWTATTNQSAWLTLSANAGNTPATVTVMMVPGSLAPGTYADTVVFALDATTSDPVAVPVTLKIHPCLEQQLTVGAAIQGALSGSDCEAPGRSARRGDVYRLSGTAGDSVSIAMMSSELDAYLIVDSLPDTNLSSLVESDTCPDGSGNACVTNFQFPYTGDVFVQATTGAPGELGAYVLEITPPRVPGQPVQLQQFQFDSATVIAVGAAAQSASVVVAGVVQDPDRHDALTLHVELRQVGSAFTGSPTHESATVSDGETAFVIATNIADDTGYHWRARVADNTGRMSDWVSFGGNNDGSIDFTGPAADALHLEFTVQPAATNLGLVMTPAVQVSVKNSSGALVTNFGQPVDLSIAQGTGTPGAQLGGTVSRVPSSGVVTFDDLTIDAAGSGYRLTASTAGLPTTTSATFDVTDPTPDFVLFAQGFNSPILLTAPPADMSRVFVVEQGGRIRIVKNGTTLATPFLDISAEINSGGEQGLLGLAFDPDYSSNGRFYINHTGDDGDTRVVRYTVSGNADIADAASADTLLTVAQPFGNHNGGHLAFGPDNMLYIGLGDGGSGGDPQGHGQNLTTLLGNILRLDASSGGALSIPQDNPFVAIPDARSEIWISGLRNPWRYSFDRATGDLYVADVGQGSWEEVTVQAAGSGGGENFGWNVMEGAHCFQPLQGCNQTGLTLPQLEYSHSQGCSITGGYVYRGSAVPGLVGHYLYADYCLGWVRSFRLVNGQAVEQTEWTVPFNGNVTSFGEDAAGNVYVVLQDGRIYRIE